MIPMEKQLTHACAKSGSVQCLRLVLKTFGMDLIELNSGNSAGETPLHLAVIRGHSAMVDSLLALGVDTNITDGEGHSPLYYAVGRYMHSLLCYLYILHLYV